MEFRELSVWMDGRVCVCVPAHRMRRTNGWMDETRGWMDDARRARVPSTSSLERARRLVSSRHLVSCRVASPRASPVDEVTHHPSSRARPRPVSASARRRRRASLAPASRAIPRRTRRHRVRHVGARHDGERDVRGRPPGRAQARQEVPERHRASRRVLVCGLAVARRAV